MVQISGIVHNDMKYNFNFCVNLWLFARIYYLTMLKSVHIYYLGISFFSFDSSVLFNNFDNDQF